ncbi:hypothetical protein QWY86_05715 [Pedobacter aquatilis]|uniref:hypothetical protein n=1 Tax=Pedobacter aquatilis TaxID=351343 RepID=UPI0025B60FA9|nr:hypothetical protein [Pedobacter aquatilis]MDN3586153.1 hypothetical protein [Pedobacter aquatilis]
MIISTGNLKGGCGCTTVLLLLAHHLSYSGKKVYLIDLSIEGALNLLYHRSLLLLECLPFEFFRTDEHKVNSLLARLEGDQGIILIDIPKTLSSKKVQEVFAKVNYFIIPFQYGLLSVHSASAFSLLIRGFAERSKSIFLPNNNPPEDIPDELWEQQQSLRALGQLSSSIPVVFPLITLRSMHLAPACLFQLSPSLNLLCGQYLLL